jgi:rare lipoprotein A
MKVIFFCLLLMFSCAVESKIHDITTPKKTVSFLVASWYGDECKGKPMANGHPFNPDALTCASWYYPLETDLQIVHKGNSIKVTVTDRGPHKSLLKTRQLDLSRAAFLAVGGKLEHGLIQVEVCRL